MLFFLSSFLSGFLLTPSTTRRLPSLGALVAVGMAAMIVLGFFSAVFGWDHRVVLLTPLLFLLFKPKLKCWKPFLRSRTTTFLPTDPVPRLAVFCLLLLQLFAVFITFRYAGYPILSYDVLSYHIPLAMEMQANPTNALWAPTTFYGRMPLAVPMVEAFFMSSTWGGHSGIGLHFLMGVSLFLGASSCARCAQWLGARHIGKWLAATLYLYHPLLLKTTLNGLAEPLIALAAIAALEFVLIGFSTRGHRLHFLLAGLLAGTTMAMKFSSAGTVVIPIGLLVVLYGLRNREWGAWLVLKPAVYTAVGGALALFPWFGRAMVLGGHPAYPFKGETPGVWTANQAAFVVNQHEPISILSATYWTDFLAKNVTYGYTIGTVSLLVLLLILAMVFLRNKSLFPIVLVSFFGYLVYLTVRGNPDRFLVGSIVIVLPVLAAAGARFYRGLLGFVLLAPLLFTTWPNIKNALSSPNLYNFQERAMYYEFDENVMRVLQVGMEKAQEGDGKLLLLFEARAGMFPRSVSYNTVWDRPVWAEMLRSSESAAEFHQKLYDAGYSGLLVNEAEWGRLLDFYGEEWTGGGGPYYGHVGLRGPLSDDRKIELLGAFPPFVFAEFDERALTILYDFLNTLRRNTLVGAQNGPASEIWLASFPSPAFPEE